MNRSDLVDAVADACELDKRTADQAVAAVIDSVMAETKRGSKVQIFGFGTFTPTRRAARTGRNPQTGDPVKIAASTSVRFAPASAFKEALNGRRGTKKAAAKRTAPGRSGPSRKKATTASRSSSKRTGARKASASRKR